MQNQSQAKILTLGTVPKAWELHLFGAFQLLDPNGEPVRLQTRKVEGLLGLIAMNRSLGVSRDELCEILWPDRPLEVQRASLRQALTQLRRSLGNEAVESSRSHCRIAHGFPLRCDYDEPELRTGDGFMPGHEGDWFDEMRFDGLEIEDEGAQQTVVGSFTQTLNWFAVNDPRGLFSLLRARSSLTRGIAPADMLRMLDKAGARVESQGWVAYWRGCSEDDLYHCAALLENALKHARVNEDWELATEVCLELGKVYSRTGRIEDVKRIVAMADALATDKRAPVAKMNAIRLRGTVLMHWGDQRRGLGLLERSESFIDDPIDASLVQAVRAFYTASAGLDDQASKVLEQPLASSKETGHLRTGVLCAFTECLLSARGSGVRLVHPELAGLCSKIYGYGWTQFGVYADEMLAKAFNLSGDKDLATVHLKSAARGRRGSNMVRTPMESKLVEAVG